MTPSLKTELRQAFGPDLVESLLDEISVLGDLSKARTTLLGVHIVQRSEGDLQTFRNLVKHARCDKEDFDAEHFRYSQIMSWAERYSRPDHLQFFGDVLRDVAAQAPPIGGTCISHGTIGLFKDSPIEFPADLYIVPIIGGSVFISHDDGVRWEAKTVDGVQNYEGQLISAVDAPSLIVRCLKDTFGEQGPAPASLRPRA